VYEDLTLDSEYTDVQQMCTNEQGSVVSGCPTANLVGCCCMCATGFIVNQCHYFGTAASDQMWCSSVGGTWAPDTSGPCG
jgi:hypothetical protein